MYMKSTWKNGKRVATSLLGTALIFAASGSLMAQKSEAAEGNVLKNWEGSTLLRIARDTERSLGATSSK
jgi:hypothetical protein